MENKIINFNSISSPDAINFTMHWEQDGEKKNLPLTGEEYISTMYPICRKRFRMEINDFIEIIGAGNSDIYGTQIYCRACSQEKTNT